MVKKTKIVFLLLVATVSMAAGGAWRIRSLVTPDAGDIKQTVQFDEKTGNVNLLVIGLDDVEGVNRSDTLAFVTIDIDNKTIKAMSIPRDTRTTIRGRGTQKINHAFAYGGVDLVKETVVNLIGMPIHYYMVINYNNFPEIVDTLGGVDIDVPKNLKYQDKAGGLYIDIKKGWRHLDGKTALEFVRFRHDALGDIGRIQRQQQFLKALLKRIYDPANMSRLTDITKELLSVIKSDIPITQGIQLASYLKDISPQNVFFLTMPGKPAMIGGGSYWSPDLAATSTLLTSPLSYDPEMGVSGDLSND
ncbi:MAG: LytR family transcriptional regulator, partial [Synergistales bacterium]|nr:LytR family transcriptional regulator [Synergistales bacterium]